jgi:hypothetical protein
MTLRLTGQNNVVYRNGTSVTMNVTIASSGEARIEVRRPGAMVRSESIARSGGAVSLEVPTNHTIEIDVIPSTATIEASVLGVK